MAASDARPVPIKNTAYRLSFDIRDQEGDLITGGITGLDSEVSLDGAAFADCTNESTEIGTSSCLFLDLTAAEMNADTVFVKVTCTNTGAKPFTWVLYPAENTDIPVNVTAISGDTVAADNAESFFDGTGYAGTNNVIPTVTTVTGNVNGSVGSVSGAVGSVTGSVGGSVASVTAPVTVGTNNDKTGYALSGAGVTAVQSGLSTLTAAQVNTEVDTGLSDVGLTTTVTGRIDAAISTRLASASYTAPDNASVATILTRTDVATSTRATPAQVNTEMVDVLATDTYAEPASVPAATATLAAKIGWLMALARNKRTTTATTDTLRNDADSGNIATAAISDDGTTFTRSEYT